MSVLLDVNGTEYAYPEVNDTAWGADATDWAVAVTNGMLQKSGGLFLLLGDVDFGGSFGLISKYFTSRTTNPASAGAFRLANTDSLSWRNGANDGDLALTVSADSLLFNGAPIGNVTSVSDTATIDLTLTAGDITADIKPLAITDALISASAAIALSKLAALTVSRAVATTAGGVLTVSSTTATQLDYLASATAAVADATHTGLLSGTDWATFNAKQAAGNYLTALTGDGTAAGPGSSAFTLATVNSNVGSFTYANITVNAKGLVTAASSSTPVTSVGLSVPATSIFGVTGSPVTTTGTLGLTTTGTSGGIPYFSSTSQLASSGALTANRIVLGGGAGASPTALGSLGTTTTVLHGNAGGAPTFGAVDLTADVTGTLPIANGGTNNGSLSVAAGAAYYGDGTKIVALAPGSSGQVYTSGGSGAPTWSSPLTNPMTTAGDIIIGGVAGAATRLAGGTSGQWLTYGASNAPVYSDTVVRAKTIDGSSDSVQLVVEGHSTQTSNILDVQKSDTTKLLSVTNANGTAIRGSTTNDSAATGFVGEVVQSSIGFTNCPATTTWGDLTSISLTAGTWLIYAFVSGTRAGATSSSIRVGISVTSGNSSTGLSQSNNLAEVPMTTTDTSASVPAYLALLSATTTHYLKYSATFSAGTPQMAGRITAVRIR